MIPKECKRLAEVDFPIAVVSAHSAREKSIRHGHPSTLHLWWARRPLAACRAMLLALLLPDPCDENCPADFKEKAKKILTPLPGGNSRTDEELRKAILKFIGDFANWDLAANSTYLEASRALVKAAYPEETPLVVDPFAGGGSIPLEALRIGCDAFASDLNPVACLIQKVMLEDIPRHGPKLAEELRKVGADIKEKAEKELAEFYPVDPDGSRPIAYLWARTVRCEAPNCGAEIPLMRSFWLCKKDKRKRALRYFVNKNRLEACSTNMSRTGMSRTGFQPVNPWKILGSTWHKRNLPHIESPYATYFVTFRCTKDLKLNPDERQLAFDALRYWDQKRIDMDAYVVLDDHVHAVFRLIQDDRQGYMNDRQDACPTREDFSDSGTGILPVNENQESLSQIQHSIKSFSSKKINKSIGRTGPVWQDESFDRIIRDENEWLKTIEYVIQNPVKRGLCNRPEDYQFLYVKNEGRDRQDACPTVEFEIFEPKSESEVPAGTVTRAKAKCLCCGSVLPPERVRAQLSAQKGGADVIFGERRQASCLSMKPNPSRLPEPAGRGSWLW